ncbi:MAG: hypothetical protein R3213_01860 [Flavobacteriaceae bacterium]|nr:hypothetical protein [Flavobacteriaceae bacterium]
MNRVLLILLLAVFSCQLDKSEPVDLSSYLPKNTYLIIDTPNTKELKTILENDIAQRFRTLDSVGYIVEMVSLLDRSGSDKRCALGFFEDSTDQKKFALIVEVDSLFVVPDSLQDYMVETISRDRVKTQKYTFEGQTIYSSKLNKRVCYTNSQDASLNFAAGYTANVERESFTKLNSDGGSVFIRALDSRAFPFRLPLQDSIINSLANEVKINVTVNGNQTWLNGIAKFSKQRNYLSRFVSTLPQENKFSQIVPDKAEYAMSLTFDDFTRIQQIYNQQNLDSSAIDLFRNVNEVAYFRAGADHGFLLNSFDSSDILSQIPASVRESFRDLEIHELTTPMNYLTSLVSKMEFQYCVRIGDFLVFSEKDEFLKKIIVDYQNGQTLINSSQFEGLMTSLSDESSIFLYYNSNGLKDLFIKNLGDVSDFESFDKESAAAQFIIDNGFAHVNMVWSESNAPIQNKSISEEFQFTLDSEVLIDPQFVENQSNKSRDIVVQDINNILYLIDNQGKLLFKKQLDGKIMGSVEEMDSFNNGRKQLVFNTSRTLYVVSREGEDVKNFPKKFRDQITQPVSLFDYDNNKRYRLLVTQGRELLMLDKNGNKVNGFKFEKANGEIITQPQHFRLGNKDYIVFAENNKLRILSRTGKDRISVREEFLFSDNQIYPYQNKFTFSDQQGRLVQIDQNGRSSFSQLAPTSEHRFATTTQSLVSLSDNIIKIRSNSIELEFGNYTEPKIFYINDKIYVSVTDLQTNKLYLFDSQGESISGFPVYAQSGIDMDSMDSDDKPEIVTRSGSNTILVYEL